MRVRTTLILLALVIAAALFFAFHTGRQLSDAEFDVQQRRLLPAAEYQAPGDALMRSLAERAVRVEIATAELRLALERAQPAAASPWRITTPIRADADPKAVALLLNTLELLEAERVLAPDRDGVADRTAYGLQPPPRAITVAVPERSWTFEIGEASLDKTMRYVARRDQPERILTVPRDPLDTLPASLAAFRDKTVVRFDPAKLTAVVAAAGGSLVYALNATPDGWRLTEPCDDEINLPQFLALIQRLAKLRVAGTDFVADAPADLAPYGLDKPIASITLATGAERTSLFIGAKAEKSPGKAYARRSDAASVFLLPESEIGAWLLPPHVLRARFALEFAPDAVARIAFRAAEGAPLELVRDGDRWKAQPDGPIADREQTLAFLGDLSALGVSQWLDDATPRALAEHGLDAPAAAVAITLKNGRVRTLELGRLATDTGRRLARRDGRGPILVLDRDIADRIAGARALLESRVALSLPRDAITALEITRSDERLVLRRTEGVWQIEQPAAGPADAGAVEELLWKLAHLEAEAIRPENAETLEASGLGAPRIRVRITAAAKGEAPIRRTLSIGRPFGNDSVWARVDEESRLLLISAAVAQRAEAEFASNIILSFNPQRVQAVEAQPASGPEARVERRGDGWRMARPAARPASKPLADGLLDELKDLRAATITHRAPGADDLARAGLDRPEWTVRLDFGDGVTRTLRVGRETDGCRSAMSTDTPYLFSVSAARLADTLRALRRWCEDDENPE